jgi:hypothetical protein
MIVNVVAEIVNVPRYVFHGRRLMPATLNFNGHISPPPSFSFEIFDGDAIQLLDYRGAQAETLRDPQR